MHLRHSFFAAAAFAAILLPAAAQSKSATFSNSVDAYFEVPYNDSVVPAFALASMPIAGTSDFSMMGQSFSPGSSAVGYVTLGTLGAPFPFLGIDIWVDPLSAIGLFPTTTDPLGNARLTMPIPPGLPAGFNAAVQFLAFDLCGPQGMTASNAMIVVITS